MAREGLLAFVGSSLDELSRVTWPTRRSVRLHVRAVVVCVAVVVGLCVAVAVLLGSIR